MTADEVIDAAIAHGEKVGLDGLTGLERSLFLISEVEAECAINGIESFAERRGRAGLLEAAHAFRLIGADELADALVACAERPDDSFGQFERVNTCVNDHVGWDYDAIRRMVARQVSRAP